MIESPTLPASPTRPCYHCRAIGAHCHIVRPIDGNRVLRFLGSVIRDIEAVPYDDRTHWDHGALFALKQACDEIRWEAKLNDLTEAILHDNV